MEYKNINVNKKSQYISFMSPTLKNKKGHTRQLTKSIKNIPQNDLIEILRDTNELLEGYEHYSDGYEAFLEATKKFHKKSIEWVFDKTDIISKYNQDSVIRTVETKIPTKDSQGNFLSPATLLIGASGAGKTTFIKQLIGSVNTNFPATMQSNTTVGSMIAVIQNNTNELIASAKLVNKSALEDRLEQAYIQIIKQVLRNEKDIADIFYDNITIFDDKKVKLQYIISKDDINSPQLLTTLKRESSEIWESFLKTSSELPFHVSLDFNKNFSVEFFASFEEYIEESLEKSQVVNEVIEIVKERINYIALSLFNFLNVQEDIRFSIEIIDESSVVQMGTDKSFEFPKMVTVSANYQDNRKPDNHLRQIFFRALEYVSAANEQNQGKTLFPLIEHLRINGNFKPLWYREAEQPDYILIDSEGIGHDITNQSVSMQMREIMSRCNALTVIQNGAEQMQTAFAETLRSLIYNGWIDKTKFCFNRMESFDPNAHASTESKLTFINSNIKNTLKQIVSSEKKEGPKIVASRENIFEELILDKSLYFQYLKEHLEDSEKFIPLDKKEAWNQINNIEMDENTKIKIKEGFYIQLSDKDKFNPVKNINEYLKEIVKKKKKFTLEDISLKNLNPKYRADVFSSLLNDLNNVFVAEFLRLISGSPWQTVKAFNARIAGNWDNREWSPLQPEALFIALANKVIMHYLLNPENVDEIKERNELEFTTIVQQIISEVIFSFTNGQSFNEIAKRNIYTELLESCWKPGIEKLKGPGSTFDRERLIKDKMMAKFYVTEPRNFLYEEMVALVVDNAYTKALNATYR
ncbi:hypothetical protein [Paenibacillus sp. sgz500958]|uniref:hypothetical protein n=1 Tax=Paenibacillus sp. sgz500958 TaxID=3242475 RepID=UPI0036D2EC91